MKTEKTEAGIRNDYVRVGYTPIYGVTVAVPGCQVSLSPGEAFHDLHEGYFDTAADWLWCSEEHADWCLKALNVDPRTRVDTV